MYKLLIAFMRCEEGAMCLFKNGMVLSDVSDKHYVHYC